MAGNKNGSPHKNSFFVVDPKTTSNGYIVNMIYIIITVPHILCKFVPNV